MKTPNQQISLGIRLKPSISLETLRKELFGCHFNKQELQTRYSTTSYYTIGSTTVRYQKDLGKSYTKVNLNPNEYVTKMTYIQHGRTRLQLEEEIEFSQDSKLLTPIPQTPDRNSEFLDAECFISSDLENTVRTPDRNPEFLDAECFISSDLENTVRTPDRYPEFLDTEYFISSDLENTFKNMADW